MLKLGMPSMGRAHPDAVCQAAATLPRAEMCHPIKNASPNAKKKPNRSGSLIQNSITDIVRFRADKNNRIGQVHS